VPLPSINNEEPTAPFLRPLSGELCTLVAAAADVLELGLLEERRNHENGVVEVVFSSTSLSRPMQCREPVGVEVKVEVEVEPEAVLR
jgi:hypothetical protein